MDLELVKQLRQETGAGVVDARNALAEANGDRAKAADILRMKGHAKASKKADRATGEGVIGTYVHTTGKLAAMVVLGCETDFVARTDVFKELASTLAMHVAAMNPTVVHPEDVSSEVVEHERAIWREQLAAEGKTGAMVEKILEGKEAKFRNDCALMMQPYVVNPDQKVADVIATAIATTGENIKVERFVRLVL